MDKPTIEVKAAGGCWTVMVNGQYLYHDYYEGDAQALASRLRRALDLAPLTAHPSKGEIDGL